MSNLLNEIGSLSAAEKLDLIDVLWESLETDEPTLTETQRAELDQRLMDCEKSPLM